MLILLLSQCSYSGYKILMDFCCDTCTLKQHYWDDRKVSLYPNYDHIQYIIQFNQRHLYRAKIILKMNQCTVLQYMNHTSKWEYSMIWSPLKQVLSKWCSHMTLVHILQEHESDISFNLLKSMMYAQATIIPSKNHYIVFILNIEHFIVFISLPGHC